MTNCQHDEESNLKVNCCLKLDLTLLMAAVTLFLLELQKQIHCERELEWAMFKTSIVEAMVKSCQKGCEPSEYLILMLARHKIIFAPEFSHSEVTIMV